MKRVIGLIVAVLTILLISAPSYGNDWFLQVPSPDTLPKENTTPDPKAIPKTLPYPPPVDLKYFARHILIQKVKEKNRCFIKYGVYRML